MKETKKMKKSLGLLTAVSLLASSMSAVAQVDTYYWGPDGGSWNTPGYWNNGVPTAIDNAHLEWAGVATTVVDAPGAVANILYVQNGGTASVVTGGSLATTGNAVIGSFSDGKLAVNGGSVSVGGTLYFSQFGATAYTGYGELNSGSITVAGDTYIGGNNISKGMLTINGGTYTVNTRMRISAGLGDGTLNMNGGLLQLSTNGSVGNTLQLSAGSGNGIINLNGGTIDTWMLLMDNVAGGSATVNLNGGLLKIENATGGGINMMNASQMVFDGGVLEWGGDRVANFATLVDNGFISWTNGMAGMLTESWDASYNNGTSILYVDYDDVNPGYTTVWATVIPEPSTISLLVVMGCSLIGVRRVFKD